MAKMSPLLASLSSESMRGLDKLATGLRGRPVIDPRNRPDDERFVGVKYALVWQPDKRLFDRLPDLEVIFSAGAGVDHIFACENVPDVPIVRFVDADLTTRMSEWVCLQCLIHLRQQRRYDAQQRDRHWNERPQPRAAEVTVGIMGMGELGRDAARKLATLGFTVNGWSRTKKTIENVTCFSGDERDAFLANTHFLVGLLPLTKETICVFNRAVFKKLARHDEIASPVFINGGRGASQVEADIVSCLKDGTLGGVSLDVFEQEPLDRSSPLWDFDNAILTPHVAAVTDIAAMAAHVDRQIERYEAGVPLEHVVRSGLGY